MKCYLIKKKIPLIYLLILLLTISFILIFQNCNVNVDLQRLESTVSYSSVINGKFCSSRGDTTSLAQKFLFVIDMSLSNLGGHFSKQLFAIGSDNYAHTLGIHCSKGELYDFASICTGAVSTDPDGLRFAAIKNFVSSCNILNENNYYSAFGFGTNVMFSSTHQGSCYDPFVQDVTGFLEQIDGLAFYQESDLNLATVIHSGPDTPYNMSSTSYNNALNCIETTIQQDLFLNNNNSIYNIIFLSDGKTTDEIDPCSMHSQYNDKKSCVEEKKLMTCYNDQADERGQTILVPDYLCINGKLYTDLLTGLVNKIENRGNTVFFQPVFYGEDTEFNEAKKIMDPLKEIGHAKEIIKLKTADDINALSALLCDSLKLETNSNNVMQSYMAINLTFQISEQKKMADSDLDGLLDIVEEKEDKFDPANSRTYKALDGLCNLVGINKCKALVCDSQKFFGLGFNECDKKLLEEYSGKTIDGIDSDKDGIPDFIELLKGTNIVVYDSDISSGDNDSFNNFYEISHGYDLNNNDDLFPIASENQIKAVFNLTPDDSECVNAQEIFNFQLKNIPLVELNPYDDIRIGPFNLSHKKDENIVAIIYSTLTLGDANPSRSYYINFIRIPYSLTEQSRQQDMYIKPQDFIYFGQIDL